MSCPRCGAALRPGLTRCAACGQPIASSAPKGPPAAKPADEDPWAHLVESAGPPPAAQPTSLKPPPAPTRGALFVQEPATRSSLPRQVLVPLPAGRSALVWSATGGLELVAGWPEQAHAQLLVTPTGAHLRDRSAHGTCVDGRLLHREAAPLRHGAELELGATRVVVALLPDGGEV